MLRRGTVIRMELHARTISVYHVEIDNSDTIMVFTSTYPYKGIVEGDRVSISGATLIKE
jgi:hypothetical protein